MLSSAATLAAIAEQNRIPLDPTRSSVHFQIPLLLLGQVRGQFTEVSGELLRVDEGWRVCADVAVGSALMRRAKDRQELLGPSFFDAQRHPQLRFVSDVLPRDLPIEGTTLQGRLSVRGYTRTARFVVHEVQCPELSGSAGCRFSLHGAIRRSDFGMRARPAVLGNTVTLELRIALCGDPQGCGAARPSARVCEDPGSTEPGNR